MNAKEGQRFYKERTKLETVIPLNTPFILFVDPSSLCNFNCVFCPCNALHKNLWSEEKRKTVGIMKFELYKKIIDQSSLFPDRIKVLRLYGHGEPLLNPKFPEMVAYGKASGCFGTIDTTTNGYLLRPEYNRQIIDAGIDRINISIEALNASGYKDVCGVKLDYDKFLENLKDLYKNRKNCHIFIKTAIDSSKIDEKQFREDFYKIYGDICDEISIEHIVPCWPGYDDIKNDGNGMYSNKRVNKIVCSFPFYILVINSDGTATRCCADWNKQLVFGNINDNTLPDLWNKMRPFQIMQLKGLRCSMDICKICEEVNTTVIDDIDSYREILLTKY